MAIAFRSQAAAGNDTTASTVVTKPAGVVSGDFLFAVCVVSQDDTGASAVTSSGWTTLTSLTAVDGDRPRVAMLYKIAGGSEPANYTFTKNSPLNSQLVCTISAYSGVNTTTPILVSPALTTTSGTGTAVPAPSINPTLPAGTDNAMLLCVFTTFKFNATANSQRWTPPSGMTEASDFGGVWAHQEVAYQSLTASGATGTKTATFVNTTQTGSKAWSLALRSAVSATAPTNVSAGADATIDQYEPFTRTATANNGGAAITSWNWTVVSGPNQVGATIGTTATVSWEPTVGGVYTLGVTATNSQGTSPRDDVVVTVNALNFPVTGNLRMYASHSGLRNSAVTRSANLKLNSVPVTQAAKKISTGPFFNLKLSASATGMKMNSVNALLKLHAALTSVSRPGAGAATARLKLSGSATAQRATTGIVVSPKIVLRATRTGTSKRTRTISATVLRLTAARTGTKRVTRSVNPVLKLTAQISAVFHTTKVWGEAVLPLSASVSNRSRTSAATPVLANIVLTTSTVTSSVHFNQNVSDNIILHASVFTQRIVSELEGIILPRADNTTQYDLVCVARIPVQNAPPILLEVDPIDWTNLTHTEELNSAPTLSATAKISNLTEPVLQRLRKPQELPSELRLYRNGKQVFSGPVLGFNVSGESLTIEAQGVLAYLKMMFLTKDIVAQNWEQFNIVNELINQWQDLDYGDFGIDTTATGSSGVQRSITYLYKEIHNVDQRVNELSRMAQGFDITVDPTDRKLQLHYPFKGVDRSQGEDAIVFDDRNVTDTNFVSSIAPSDLASEAFGTGPSSDDKVLVSTQSNLELRTRYGRTGVTGTFSDVSDQATLDSYVAAMRDARGAALLIPGPNVRVSTDADLGMYDVGDTVDYQLHSQLAVSGAFRIRKRAVAVAETGTESVSIEFV